METAGHLAINIKDKDIVYSFRTKTHGLILSVEVSVPCSSADAGSINENMALDLYKKCENILGKLTENNITEKE